MCHITLEEINLNQFGKGAGGMPQVHGSGTCWMNRREGRREAEGQREGGNVGDSEGREKGKATLEERERGRNGKIGEQPRKAKPRRRNQMK